MDDDDEGGRIGALWRLVERRPRDSVAVLAAVLASAAILANALFLQSGPHPAPIFLNKPPAAKAVAQSDIALLPRPRPAEPARPDATRQDSAQIAVRHGDPIAQLLASTPRIAAVQQVLTEFGYGQIQQTGMLDPQTVAAIEKFERARQLPVTGRISNRLLQELSAMSGRQLN